MNYARQEKAIGIGLFAFSLIYFYGSTQLKLGVVENPGAGFMPTVIAVLLLGATSLYLYQLFSSKVSSADKRSEEEKLQGGNAVTLYLGGCLVLYPILLSTVDFLIATAFLVYGSLRLLQYRNKCWSAVLAVILPAVTYFVFAKILGVALPTGILEVLLLRVGG